MKIAFYQAGIPRLCLERLVESFACYGDICVSRVINISDIMVLIYVVDSIILS